MPEKVTREEKLLELAIAKAKEVLQEANVNTMKIDEPLTGEEVKVKRPKENPKEVPLPKTSNIEGKENKISKTSKEILKAPFDARQFQSMIDEKRNQEKQAALQKLPVLLKRLFDGKLQDFMLAASRDPDFKFSEKPPYKFEVKGRDAAELLAVGDVDILKQEMERLYANFGIEIFKGTNGLVVGFTPRK
tara:strand:+ start:4864 stop:5433 length:570 start_codon:yes stop_codon:yes gene_type:complete